MVERFDLQVNHGHVERLNWNPSHFYKVARVPPHFAAAIMNPYKACPRSRVAVSSLTLPAGCVIADPSLGHTELPSNLIKGRGRHTENRAIYVLCAGRTGAHERRIGPAGRDFPRCRDKPLPNLYLTHFITTLDFAFRLVITKNRCNGPCRCQSWVGRVGSQLPF